MMSETSAFLPFIAFASSPSGSFPPAQNTGHQQRAVLPTFVENDCISSWGIREGHEDMAEVYQRVQ